MAQPLSGDARESPNRSRAMSGNMTVLVLSLMLLLTPALGVPHEELLQDTLKSMVVSFMTLGAALLFFWDHRKHQQPLRWHALMWVPLLLMCYALGSMAWSHTYLAGVEAIRWFIVGLLLWLGLNTFTRERIGWLALGIHAGALIASIWAVLQFWMDFRFFPQGAHPASTFINRNFFAEMVICSLPFSAYLLAQAKGSRQIALRAFGAGFIIVALMMTGTRSALATLWLSLFVIFPLIGFLFRHQFAFARWNSRHQALAILVLFVTVMGLGLIPGGNPNVAAEQRGSNAIERGILRSALVVQELSDKQMFQSSSISIRAVMWKATMRMIADHPVNGVGAGAWEIAAPLYQAQGTPMETDYYVHNEVLQLLAEYGLVGWIVLIGLLGYLAQAVWRTFQDRMASPAESGGDAGMRALALASLLALLLVSNAGFPLRLASTGAIFAVALGILAASDTRQHNRAWTWVSRLPWRAEASVIAALACVMCMGLAFFISLQAAASEYSLVRAVKMAMRISRSGDPNNPGWNNDKQKLLTLVGEGIRINPHYRKITPMVADDLARWGDWKNATLIWESVITSRPYIVAILANMASGYAQMGDNAKALEIIERCKKIQPDVTVVHAMELALLVRLGREPEAVQLARKYLREGIYDYNLANGAIAMGLRRKDYDLAIEGLEARNKISTAGRVEAFLELGGIYAGPRKDESKALAAYKNAVAASPEAAREQTRQKVPKIYRDQL